MTGPEDQEATMRASRTTAEDLAAMVRVLELEQRCRDIGGQARLAEEGRRRLKQVLHQQQIQTDIAPQHRREAEDAYQQVRGGWHAWPVLCQPAPTGEETWRGE